MIDVDLEIREYILDSWESWFGSKEEAEVWLSEHNL